MDGRLEKLAWRLASSDRAAAGGDPQMTRRDLVGRGLLGALALTGAARLVFADSGFAAATACTSLQRCLEEKEAFWGNVIQKCHNNHGWTWECVQTYHEGRWRSSFYCRRYCPPPKKPKKKPPSRGAPNKGNPPPPLPPDGDDSLVAECANCAQVGGRCCYGKDPKHLCVCANPDYTCARYGCGS
jgi:hypothetical protein